MLESWISSTASLAKPNFEAHGDSDEALDRPHMYSLTEK
jgi:hypothetical protein